MYTKKIRISFLLIIPFIGILLGACDQTASYKYPFQNPELSRDIRVKDLIQRLTPEEKAAQLLFNAPAIDRLSIPAYNWWNECLHGVARNGLATVFPQAIGMAASFDTAQISRIAVAISDEARAKYHKAIRAGEHYIYQGLTFWTPNINIFRDPRWGRGMETYGEDPYLTGSIAVNFIRGLQGDDPKYLKVVATAKHFSVHSGPESTRHSYNAEISNSDLYNTYLPHFKRAVKEANVQSIMCAYNRLEGEPCCGSDNLLNKILREQWGFGGYIVTDCWGLVDFYRGHNFSDGPTEASAAALLAGTDLNCGIVYNNLIEAVDAGLIEMADIDAALTRLLTARFKLGMFDPDEKVPYAQIPEDVINCSEHQGIALEAARKSMVLLKNKNSLLPLKKDISTLAIIGPHAMEKTAMLGNYHGIPSDIITVFDGIKDKLSSDTRILHARGCNIAEGVPHLQTIPHNVLYRDSTLNTNGIQAEFFDNDSLGGEPVQKEFHDSIDFNWWEGAPYQNLPKDKFSIRWTGYLVSSASGEYHLGGDGSHEFRVFLNDSLLAEQANPHYKTSVTEKVFLEAGKGYKIRIDFINHERFAMMNLVWALPESDLMSEAIEIAKQADAVVLCMGLSPKLEGEEMEVAIDGFSGGDRTRLTLPAIQLQLMKEMKQLNKPVILVLFNGSALALNWENENLDAILEAWYPGQACGIAIADILFGDYNPAGRLPVTFYKSVSDLPDFENYNMEGRTYRYFKGDPLFEFGFGLSYTQFEYRDLTVSTDKISMDTSCKLEFEIHNTGNYDGEEVIQLYISKKDSRFIRPIKELKAFQRVSIAKGSSEKISFTIVPKDLIFFDESGSEVVEPGEYELLLGSSSDRIQLRQILELI